MRYYSTTGRAETVGFREAVLVGLAPDGGLYLPAEIPALPGDWRELGRQSGFAELAARVAAPYVAPALTGRELEGICASAFDFPLPVTALDQGMHALELFWGPTFAFKDFGARFLARVINHFAVREARRLTILVATSGDTGSAVANGFYGMDAVDVVLLYPSGRVSPLQEQQLTTVGGNVAALEVRGSFDECQKLVKQAFADREITGRRPLSSANSINIGRLVPQALYYVSAAARLDASHARPLTISVPSGNYGNVTGALLAWEMGLPVARLVVGSNDNDVVPRFLASGVFSPQPAVRTPANAMDVGDPSNLTRIRTLLGYDMAEIRRRFTAHRVSSPEIIEVIRRVREETGYLLDPHSAVGYEALRRHRSESAVGEGPAIFAATAHPAKFAEAILDATGEQVEIPDALAAAAGKRKVAVPIDASFAELKAYLLDTA